MKHRYILTLFFTFVLCASCASQNKPDIAKENKSETKASVSSPTSIHTTYEYTEFIDQRLIIQNSFPKSGGYYVDPTGKRQVYAVFWTQIINETETSYELKIDFPLEPHELPSNPGVYYRVFLPTDTMTLDKELLYDYGLTSMKSFLDSNVSKASSINRIVSSKASSAFYVVVTSNKGVNGPIRTGFNLKGQDLYYRINKDEFLCGTINLKRLKKQKQ